MPDELWRDNLAVTALLLFIVIVESYLLILSSYQHQPASEISKTTLTPWTYHPDRNSRNIGLTAEQCDSAFPDLYYEIERAKSYWKDLRHTITPDDIDIGWTELGSLRALIYNNELRIVETNQVYPPHWRFGKRTFATLNQIHRALLGAQACGESIPNIEFAITMMDKSKIPDHGTQTIWTYDRDIHRRPADRTWLIPDFQFWAAIPYAGSFSEMRSRAAANDKPLSEKIPKAVWRGRLSSNRPVREALVAHTEGKEWADVEVVPPGDYEIEYRMSMDELCKYRFVIHTEGISWSGRLKYLLNCDSVPFIHDLKYAADYYHLLISEGPKQNYVKCRRNWSDLEEKVLYYLAHPDEAQRIANNVKATFRDRNTSPAAEACYWRRLMRRYSEVSFEPEPFKMVDVNTTGVVEQQQRLRGWSIEHFLYYEPEKKFGWGFEKDVEGAG